MFDKILSFVAPHTCCGCGNIGNAICEHCMNDIINEPYDLCVVCCGPAESHNLCLSCSRTSPWDIVWVVGQRKEILKKLVDLYKFERVMAADVVLAKLLAHRLPLLPPGTVVTYVPSTAAHRRQRGYDTMQRIAVALGKQLDLKVMPLLERQHDVVQRDAKKEVRLKQQDKALAASVVAVNTPILLIDDIYTTGSTLRAAVEKLKQRHTVPVYVAVIARQPLDDVSDL